MTAEEETIRLGGIEEPWTVNSTDMRNLLKWTINALLGMLPRCQVTFV